MIKWFILLCIHSFCTFASVDFHASLSPRYHLPKSLIEPLSKAYALNHYQVAEHSYLPRIPKIIHHIWLGDPFPEKYQKYVDSWKRHHPDWTFYFWTDQDLDQFPLAAPIIQRCINQAHRADILRLAVLEAYGGLYVDTDFLCLKPHDVFHHTCDFYAGLQSKLIGNGLIGAKAHHPIIKACLKKIYQTNTFIDHHENIIKNTGPDLLTRKIKDQLIKSLDGTIIYPHKYFFPFPATKRFKYWENESSRVYLPSLRDESFAVHLWAVSWIKPKSSPQ